MLHQVPAAPGSFTGRADELAILTLTLDKETGRDATVVISAFPGTRVTTWLALQESARHLGHLDIVAELAEGLVGE